MKQPAATPGFPAPIAAYALNEDTGTTAADATGNGHTLNLNTATWTSSGHTGAALTNTAATPGASTTSLTTPSGAVTLMAWIKPLQLTAGTTNFATGFVAGDATELAIFSQRADFGSGNVLQGDIRIAGNLIALNGTALTVGTWVHVAITFDGTTARLYRDGVQEASVVDAGSTTPGDGLYVAGWSSTSPYPTNIVVDDVRVFDVALTQTQVSTAMSTPV